MRTRLTSVVSNGLDLLFPPQCTLCQAETDATLDQPLLCLACRNQLLLSEAFRCPRCGGTSPLPVPNGQRCGHCRTSRLQFTRTVAIGVYHSALQQAVLQMKRPERTALTMAMANLFWEARGTEIAALGADLIVPIPMHWWRRCVRGVNSAELVAETIGRNLQRPVTRLLRRRARPPQNSLTPHRRRLNLRGAMSVRSRRNLADLRVLLVDDVLTTGATCSEAARALRQAGAADVVAAVLARGEGEY